MKIIIYITSPGQTLALLSSLLNSGKLNKCNLLKLYIFPRNIIYKKNLGEIIKRFFLNHNLNNIKIKFLPHPLIYIYCLLFKFTRNSFLFLPAFHLGPILVYLISENKSLFFGEGFGYFVKESPNWAKPLPFQWRFFKKSKSINNFSTFNSNKKNQISLNYQYLENYLKVIEFFKIDLSNRLRVILKNLSFTNTSRVFLLSALAEKNGRIDSKGELALYYDFIKNKSQENSTIYIYSHPRHSRKLVLDLINLLSLDKIDCFDLRSLFNNSDFCNYPVEIIIVSLLRIFNEKEISINVFQQSALFLSILGHYNNLEIGFSDVYIYRYFHNEYKKNRVDYEFRLKKECLRISSLKELF